MNEGTIIINKMSALKFSITSSTCDNYAKYNKNNIDTIKNITIVFNNMLSNVPGIDESRAALNKFLETEKYFVFKDTVCAAENGWIRFYIFVSNHAKLLLIKVPTSPEVGESEFHYKDFNFMLPVLYLDMISIMTIPEVTKHALGHFKFQYSNLIMYAKANVDKMSNYEKKLEEDQAKLDETIRKIKIMESMSTSINRIYGGPKQ